MTKVHPNANSAHAEDVENALDCEKPTLESTVVLTVWRKSLLFNGNGFTVFDGTGNLVFRVDNYASDNKAEIVLMDAQGKPLLTIRRKKLSLGDHWLIYDGEEAMTPRFSAKKLLNFFHSKSLAHIHHCSPSTMTTLTSRGNSPCSSPKSPFSGTNNVNALLPSSPSSSSTSPCSSPKAAGSAPAFEVEGCYTQRCCVIYDDTHTQIAEIKQKEANNGGAIFGLDVFELIVQPGFDAVIAMAIVILLEQMFGSRGSSLFIRG